MQIVGFRLGPCKIATHMGRSSLPRYIVPVDFYFISFTHIRWLAITNVKSHLTIRRINIGMAHN